MHLLSKQVFEEPQGGDSNRTPQIDYMDFFLFGNRDPREHLT